MREKERGQLKTIQSHNKLSFEDLEVDAFLMHEHNPKLTTNFEIIPSVQRWKVGGMISL